MRDAGVILYKEKGRVSFCPDDDNDKVAMIGGRERW